MFDNTNYDVRYVVVPLSLLIVELLGIQRLNSSRLRDQHVRESAINTWQSLMAPLKTAGLDGQ